MFSVVLETYTYNHFPTQELHMERILLEEVSDNWILIILYITKYSFTIVFADCEKWGNCTYCGFNFKGIT